MNKDTLLSIAIAFFCFTAGVPFIPENLLSMILPQPTVTIAQRHVIPLPPLAEDTEIRADAQTKIEALAVAAISEIATVIGEQENAITGTKSEPVAEVVPAKHQKLAKWISEKYDIAADKSLRIVRSAFENGMELGVDPLLILAVICIESRFVDTVGGRNGQGLMQIVPKWHAERIKTMSIAREGIKDIETNIRLGSHILKDYLNIARQDVPRALQMYNGSLEDKTRFYSRKVLESFRTIQKAVPAH